MEGMLEAGLCKGELVDEEGDGICGCCCCRPPLGSSVGGCCEGDPCWEGEDGISQTRGGGDQLLLCGLVEAGVDGDKEKRTRKNRDGGITRRKKGGFFLYTKKPFTGTLKKAKKKNRKEKRNHKQVGIACRSLLHCSAYKIYRKGKKKVKEPVGERVMKT